MRSHVLHRSVVLAIPHFEPTKAIARAAESAGYYRVWTTESTDRDAIIRAAAIGSATSTIKIGTGIAYAFTRLPVAMASAASDTQAACSGRFALGLGAGTRGLRQRYGLQWEHPAPQFADYMSVLRSLLHSDGSVEYSGDYYQVQLPEFITDQLARCVELYGSGVNRIMLRQCAAVCDGVAIHSLAAAPGYLEEVTVPAIAAGGEIGGREPRVACWYIACVDADEERARESAKRQLAFYLSTPSYRTVAEFGGWGDVAERVRITAAETKYSDWAAVARLVPEHVVDALTIAGTPEQVRTRLPEVEKRLMASGIDEIVFQMVGTEMSADEVTVAGLQLIDACAPR
jgi:probable F420-dependent oxidoreductase